MRRLGVLLHIASLYGRDLIGTLGRSSFDMLERLSEARLSIWQMLPVCPIGYGASPYASSSLFAGNVLLLDVEELAKEGLIDDRLCGDYFFQIQEYRENYACSHSLSQSDGLIINTAIRNKIDYEMLTQYKIPFLRECALSFLGKMKSDEHIREEYQSFCEQEVTWLDDYALFVVLARKYVNVKDIIKKSKTARGKLACIDNEMELELEVQKVLQFFFFKQWNTFKKKAQEMGILLFGDVPMFPSYDSADVVFNPDLFCLDNEGEPTFQAGVPPDYFSSDGQLWGNPVYDWEKMQEDDYAWWCKRIKHNLKLFDYLRLDHFRGFEAFWAVRQGEVTAKNGKWLEAGGYRFFEILTKTLGDKVLPLIAEDLGIITDKVRALKDSFHLKGMCVLHFAFNVAEYKAKNLTSTYLPHNVSEASVIYTGTHDNNTTVGWLSEIDSTTRNFVCEYVGVDSGKSDEEVCRALVRSAIFSRAEWAIIPMQDFCCLDGSARMNTPSTTQGNWQWRMSEDMFDKNIIRDIANMAVLFSRG